MTDYQLKMQALNELADGRLTLDEYYIKLSPVDVMNESYIDSNDYEYQQACWEGYDYDSKCT